MKRLGYVRTSTNKQYTDRQVNKLKKCCDKVYIEDGVSARSKARPVLNQILADLDAGDEFVVTAYDRAFRSVIEGLTTLDDLTERDITPVSLSQQVDPTTPDGRLYLTIILGMGEWEVNVLAQRTIEGLKAAVRRGKTLGRPRKKLLKPLMATGG